MMMGLRASAFGLERDLGSLEWWVISWNVGRRGENSVERWKKGSRLRSSYCRTNIGQSLSWAQEVDESIPMQVAVIYLLGLSGLLRSTPILTWRGAIDGAYDGVERSMYPPKRGLYKVLVGMSLLSQSRFW
jgi:hypothetical protein